MNCAYHRARAVLYTISLCEHTKKKVESCSRTVFEEQFAINTSSTQEIVTNITKERVLLDTSCRS